MINLLEIDIVYIQVQIGSYQVLWDFTGNGTSSEPELTMEIAPVPSLSLLA